MLKFATAKAKRSKFSHKVIALGSIGDREFLIQLIQSVAGRPEIGLGECQKGIFFIDTRVVHLFDAPIQKKAFRGILKTNSRMFSLPRASITLTRSLGKLIRVLNFEEMVARLDMWK